MCLRTPRAPQFRPNTRCLTDSAFAARRPLGQLRASCAQKAASRTASNTYHPASLAPTRHWKYCARQAPNCALHADAQRLSAAAASSWTRAWWLAVGPAERKSATAPKMLFGQHKSRERRAPRKLAAEFSEGSGRARQALGRRCVDEFSEKLKRCREGWQSFARHAALMLQDRSRGRRAHCNRSRSQVRHGLGRCGPSAKLSQPRNLSEIAGKCLRASPETLFSHTFPCFRGDEFSQLCHLLVERLNNTPGKAAETTTRYSKIA